MICCVFQVVYKGCICLEDRQNKCDADGLNAHKWMHIWLIELFLAVCVKDILFQIIWAKDLSISVWKGILCEKGRTKSRFHTDWKFIVSFSHRLKIRGLLFTLYEIRLVWNGEPLLFCYFEWQKICKITSANSLTELGLSRIKGGIYIRC